MTKNSIVALFILTLAACASERSSEPGASSSTGSYPSDGSSPSTTSTTTSQSSTTGTMANSGSGMSSSSPSAQTSYGVVQAIDQMQRQDVGVGAVGAAAAGGSVGLPTDKVYRVTVRMDDGNSQMVVVDSMPSYKIGDRVRYNNGALTNY
ncbi:hypothetical protein [Duganella sp. S19_KUP01_CR8]|uniref:hypothetical protein n=1 Tax=Duganella sp. S19_KUP01_CR8 TaxID=3025502 RepID=UPI002FCDC3A7